MIDPLLTAAQELLRNFRIADAVDICVIAVLLYCALLWFGETASRRVLVGVTLLALAYLTARMFDMHLTSLVFHTGFTVLLILLIVVFQDDLRRMLSRAAAWMSLPRTGGAAADGELNVLAESAFSLAQRKIGALLVLPGKEPLDRHVSGGVLLDGKISAELLDSIFDPSSDGHDGAAIAEGERLTLFGAHLPISTNLGAIKGHGTRHSAALGLTECSDAVVIVVSEERGVVSVARAGRLRQYDSPAALLKVLEDLPAARGASALGESWTRHLTTHWRMKVLALALALVAWFVLAYDPSTVARTFDVPIEYRNLPAGLAVDRPISQAQLTLSGSETSFRFVTPESLKITVNLSGQAAGSHKVILGEENIQLPANVAIDSIEPGALLLYLREQPPKPNGAGGTP